LTCHTFLKKPNSFEQSYASDKNVPELSTYEVKKSIYQFQTEMDDKYRRDEDLKNPTERKALDMEDEEIRKLFSPKVVKQKTPKKTNYNANFNYFLKPKYQREHSTHNNILNS
jgi:hypothetical protein